MKPQTFFKFTLAIPYVLWGVCLLIVYLTGKTAWGQAESSYTGKILELLLMLVFYYTFGALIWFIPYTLLATGLLVWSHRKPMRDVYKVAVRSPLFLAALMSMVSIMISINSGSVVEILKNALQPFLLFGSFSLIFGYVCVGIAIGLYRLLRSKILVEEQTAATIESLSTEG